MHEAPAAPPGFRSEPRERRTAASARRTCLAQTPGSRSTICPACDSTSRLAIGSPRPMPVRRGSTDSRPGMRKNFWKTCSRRSGGMPGPLVLNREADVAIVCDCGTHANRRVHRRVLARVVDERVQRFADRGAIDRELRQVRLDGHDDVMSARDGLRASDRLAHDLLGRTPPGSCSAEWDRVDRQRSDPSMKRFRRSDSSSMTTSRSRRLALESGGGVDLARS